MNRAEASKNIQQNSTYPDSMGRRAIRICRKSGQLDSSLKIGYIGSLKWKKFLQTTVLGYVFIYVQIKD
jgi:hypothetical protein